MIGRQRTGAGRPVVAAKPSGGRLRRYGDRPTDYAVKPPAAKLVRVAGCADDHCAGALLDRTQQLGQPISRRPSGRRLLGGPVGLGALNEHRHSIWSAPDDLGEQSLVAICGPDYCQ
jgi:hypothetical protein